MQGEWVVLAVSVDLHSDVVALFVCYLDSGLDGAANSEIVGIVDDRCSRGFGRLGRFVA